MTSTFLKLFGCLLLMATYANAQLTLAVSPSKVLTEGEDATIEVSGATGSTVTVTIDNGQGDEQVITIDIDDQGKGSTTWTVPTGWEVAKFNMTGVGEVVRLVEPPSAYRSRAKRNSAA